MIKVYKNYYNEEVNIDENDIICCTKWFNLYGNATYGIYTSYGKFYSINPYDFHNAIYNIKRYIPIIIVDHKREL